MSTRSLLRRLTPFIAGRIRQNSRLLSSSSSADEASPSTSPSPDSQESIHMTESCIRKVDDGEFTLDVLITANPRSSVVALEDRSLERLKELQVKEASSGEKMLRLSVETGGCSGFQYVFLLDDNRNTDDRVFEKDGVKLVVDNVSYDFVKGATVDYVEELIRSAFLVTTNPSAVGGCSCKSSFMVK